MPPTKEQPVISVSQYIDLVRDYFSGFGEAVVQGEVSNYRIYRNGQLTYFHLKDEESQVLCFGISSQLRVELKDGMEIRVLGEPDVSKRRGDFYLKIKAIELVGQGALQLALERLKKQLEQEGLFNTERKRPVPKFPAAIGLVTSPEAAAYNDVLRVAKNRWPIKIKFFSAQVQGIQAVKSLVRALSTAQNDEEIEAVILTRGGGSLEDLQAFNSEGVARAVFASRVPVVCGVGHERDWTIADLVADVRAATPSNAAELLLPDHKKVLADIDGLKRRITSDFDNVLAQHDRAVVDMFRRLEQGLRSRLSDFTALTNRFVAASGRVTERLIRRRELVKILSDRLIRAQEKIISDKSQRVLALERLVNGLSPRALLSRGFSIVYKDKHVVKSISALQPQDQVRVRLSDGRFSSIINDTTHD